jgi:hypothetical protein
MTKGAGQKHFQREDHAHAAHQEEAARPKDRDAVNKVKPGANPGPGGHPVEQPPKSPHKGQ